MKGLFYIPIAAVLCLSMSATAQAQSPVKHDMTCSNCNPTDGDGSWGGDDPEAACTKCMADCLSTYIKAVGDAKGDAVKIAIAEAKKTDCQAGPKGCYGPGGACDI